MPCSMALCSSYGPSTASCTTIVVPSTASSHGPSAASRTTIVVPSTVASCSLFRAPRTEHRELFIVSCSLFRSSYVPSTASCSSFVVRSEHRELFVVHRDRAQLIHCAWYYCTLFHGPLFIGHRGPSTASCSSYVPSTASRTEHREMGPAVMGDNSMLVNSVHSYG
jgi:hypothetical protein